MTHSLVDLKAQARQSYRYWHLVLEYRKRHLSQRVHTSAIQHTDQADENAFALLQQRGFPGLPVTLAGITVPGMADPGDAVQIQFQSLPAPDDDAVAILRCVRLLADGQQESAEIMAVRIANLPYLQQASAHFNDALTTHNPHLVYRAACLWSALHQGSPGFFQPLDKDDLSLTTENPDAGMLAIEDDSEQPASPVSQSPVAVQHVQFAWGEVEDW